MKRFSILLYLLLIGSVGNSVWAQKTGQALVDSLQKELNSPKYRNKEDTNTINLLKNLCFTFSSIDPDQGIMFGNKAMALSQKLNWKKGIAMANVSLAANYLTKAEYPKALDYYFKAIPIYEELENKLGVVRCHGNIGLVYLYQGDYVRSMEYNLKSLHGYEELGDKAGVSRSLMNIGSIQWQQSNYPKALEWFYKALKINEEIGDKKQIALVYNNIGALYRDKGDYPLALECQLKSLKNNEALEDIKGMAGNLSNMGNIYLDQKNYPQSLEYYFKALHQYEKISDKNGLAIQLGNIGLVYQFQKDYKHALEYDLKALALCEELGDQNGIARNEGNIGAVYLEQNNLPKALDYILNSLAKFRAMGNRSATGSEYMSLSQVYFKIASGGKNHSFSKLFPGNKKPGLKLAQKYADTAIMISMETGDLNSLSKSYETLSEILSQSGDYKGSLENYRRFKQLNDSVFNMEKDKKLTQASMQYEFDKKESLVKAAQEKKNALAQKEIERQKLMRNGFVGGFALMLLFAIIFFRQRNNIQKGKKLSDELLLNILPAEVAEELKAKGSAEAKLIDEVTVLFTDFKGFTQLSEKLSPQLLVAEINECFSAFDTIMHKNGVEKIKTIGDAYMAAGGLPTPNVTHATDVVNAALEIQQFMQGYQLKKESANEPFFEIRIGIHTGHVVAGIVGLKKFAYDIWGDTVNTASRMESSGEAGKVNISGATYECLNNLPDGQTSKFSFTYRGEIEAKNKGAMKMYFVE